MAAMWVRNRLLAEISHEIELTREEIRLSRESREETRDFMRHSQDDMREFMREITTRMERVTRVLVAEVREGRDEQRAQTKALLRLIDRMDRLDPGGAAA